MENNETGIRRFELSFVYKLENVMNRSDYPFPHLLKENNGLAPLKSFLPLKFHENIIHFPQSQSVSFPFSLPTAYTSPIHALLLFSLQGPITF